MLVCLLFVLCLISFVPKAIGIVLAYGIWHATVSQAGTLVRHCRRLGLLVCHCAKHRTLVCHWFIHRTLICHGLTFDILVCQHLVSGMPQSQIWHCASWLPFPMPPYPAICRGRPGLGTSPLKFKRAKIYNFYPAST